MKGKVLILFLCLLLTVSVFAQKQNKVIDIKHGVKNKIDGDESNKIKFKRTSLSTIGETNCGSLVISDINGDGLHDIVAGFQWFEAPSWHRHQYAQKEKDTRIDTGMLNVFDIDSDGDSDIIMQRRRKDGRRELIWFENPSSIEENFWDKHIISYKVSCIETIEFVDIDYDGRIEMLTVDDCLRPSLLVYDIPTNLSKQWKPSTVICKSVLHGLGIGDLNSDGYLDIVSDYRWYENRLERRWKEHVLPKPSNNRTHMNMQILIYDIDNDGDNDIFVTQAHDYGAYWLESRGGASPTFILHKVKPGKMPSQLHGVSYGDIDNDGDIDVFLGKCRYSHGDPGQKDPLDVFWLELVRSGTNVNWVKHQLASDLVMGFQPQIYDIDNDGDNDLLMRSLGLGNYGVSPLSFDVVIFENLLY